MYSVAWSIWKKYLSLGSMLMVLLGSACAALPCTQIPQAPDPFAGPCIVPFSVPSLPHVFVSPVGLVMKENGSLLRFTCNIQEAPPTTSRLSVMYKFHWEFNGNVIHRNQSTLEIVASETTEGVYRCIVGAEYVGQNNSLATVVSNPVTLELPKIDGWRDKSKKLTNQSQSALITTVLPIDGFTVLECEPQTNNPLPSSATVWWLRNNTRILDGDPKHHRLDKWRMLVSHFALAKGENTVQYKCFVAGLQFFNQPLNRTFNIMSMSEDVSTPPQMLPTSESVVVGGNVTFYCFTNYKQLSNVTWWKDDRMVMQTGQRLGGGNNGMLLIVQEVLVLSNVSEEDGGVYSCRGASGVELHSANLTIISPPTGTRISASQNTVIRIGRDLITRGRDVNLTCLQSSSSASHVSYTWYIQGELVPTNYPGLGKDGSTLALRGGANGTVQCFASNEAGISSDAVIVLSKPRPPTHLIVKSKMDNQYKFVYGLGFNLPEVYAAINVTVSVRVMAKRQRDQILNVCSYSGKDLSYVTDVTHTVGGVDLPVQDIVKNARDSYILVEVALNVAGVSSEFVALQKEGSCKIEVHLKAIPQDVISQRNISYNSLNGDSWSLDFHWSAPYSVISTFLIYGNTSLSCGGLVILHNRTLNRYHNTEILNVSVPTCASCFWTVTYSNPEGVTLTDSVSFTSKVTAPTTPPSVSHVTRVGADGKTIKVSFRVPPQSCREAELWVNYSLSSNSIISSPPISLNGSSCSSSPDSSHSYTCDVVLGECWQPYSVSLAYSNSGKNVAGPYSQPFTLSHITERDLHVEGLHVNSESARDVQLQLNISRGLDCLLRRTDSVYSLKVCWNKTSEMGSYCPNGTSDEIQCKEVDNNRIVSINGLTPETMYVYRALVTSGNHTVCSPVNGVIFTTSKETPTNRVLNRRQLTSKNRVYTVVTIVTIATAVVVVGVALVMCVVKKRRKKKNHRPNLSPLQDKYEDDMEDPVDITRQDRMETQSQATSIHGYEGNFILRKFLEGPDGSEQELVMDDEDYYNSKDSLSHVDSDSSGIAEGRHLYRSASPNSSKKKIRKKRKKAKKSDKKYCSENSKLLEEVDEDEEEMMDSNTQTNSSNKSSHASGTFTPRVTSYPTQIQDERCAGSGDGYVQDSQLCGMPSNMASNLLQSSSTRSNGETSGTTNFSEDSTQYITAAPDSMTTRITCLPDSMETSWTNFPSVQYSYTPNSQISHFSRTLSGGQSSSSGYASQSVDSSIGWRALGMEQLQSSGYMSHHSFSHMYGTTTDPFSSDRTADINSSGYARVFQDERTIVEKIPADEDNGSLSSDSVFSDNISFTFSSAGHTREGQSEGYCSLPLASNSALVNEEEEEPLDYMNVNHKEIATVQFEPRFS